MPPSPQQSAVLSLILDNEVQFKPRSYTRRHILVQARAGSGKTTLLVDVIKLVIAKGCTVAYTMFNKATVEEMVLKCANEKLPKDTLDCIRTANSFGNRAFQNFRRGARFQLEPGKSKLIYRELFRGHSEAWKVESKVMRLVASAKTNGIGIIGVDEHATQHGIESTNPMWEFIINHFEMDLEEGVDLDFSWMITAAAQVLKQSNQTLDIIDYDDQVYLSLLLKAPFPQYDYVLVDEGQDTNRVKRELYRRMLKAGGCLVVVGDTHQAIYGFTGADNDSLQIFKEQFDMIEMPLTTCFRCDTAIVQFAQRWVKDIEPRSGAGPGHILIQPYTEFINKDRGPQFTGNDAILCRKNAPNMRVCFQLLRCGIGCRVEGKDIGFSLIRTIESLAEEDDTSLVQVGKRLIEYQQHEIRKAQVKADDYTIDLVNDRCATISLLIQRGIEQGRDVFGLKKFIRELFSDATDPKTPRDIVTLSSVHKAKGKEWDRVFLLGRQQLMPSKFAKTEWELEQEKNLIYVAVTRAKHTLVEITNIPE